MPHAATCPDAAPAPCANSRLIPQIKLQNGFSGYTGRHDVILQIFIEDTLKLFYYRGLKEWGSEKSYFRDTCLTAQDKYKAYLDYFRIEY